MGVDWLTLRDVAEALGVRERTVFNRVMARKFPAPHRFLGDDGSGPAWPTSVLEDPGHVLRSAEASGRVDREAHLAILLDEVRAYVWRRHVLLGNKQEGPPRIIQSQYGRPGYEKHPDFPLGRRVSALRAAHKHGRVSREEAAAFEAVPGWTWDVWDTDWRRRFEEVAAAFERRGELTAADKSWVAHQRRRWGNLRPEWRALLDSHPGLLGEGKQNRVEEFVAAATKWLAEHPGQTTHSMQYAETVMMHGEKVAVGRRATYYRRRYRGLEGRRPMSDEDIAKIEALPGWSWEMSKLHVESQRGVKKKRSA